MKRVIGIVVAVFLLTACSSREEIEEARTVIQSAVQQTIGVENAIIRMSVAIETEADSFYQETSGTFIKNPNNQTEWHFVSYQPGENQLVSYELLEKSGNQYHKVITDPLEIAQWEQVESPFITYEDLFVVPIETIVALTDIRQLSKVEQTDSQVYEMLIENTTYDPVRSTHQMGTNLYLEEIGVETYSDEMRQLVDLQMERMASMEIEEAAVLYVIDQDNCVEKVTYRTDSVLPNGEWIRVEHTYRMDAYNIDEPEQLIPSAPL